MAASIAAVAAGIAVDCLGAAVPRANLCDRIGEQRSIALADGSTLELNSRSKVRVRYSEHERALELLEGQALFRVAKDTSRPFIVSCDGTRVRAVGTQFDVNKKRGGTVVTVVEGQVSVVSSVIDARIDDVNVEVFRCRRCRVRRNESRGASGILLAAGEQITVTHTAVNEITRPDVTQRHRLDAAAIGVRRRHADAKSPRSSIATIAGNSSCRTRSCMNFTSAACSPPPIPRRCCNSCASAPACMSWRPTSAIYLMKNPPAAVTDR